VTPGRLDHLVIGGGIVGVATAREILLRRPGARVALVEKEQRLAAHQTGHNSNVVHAGIYYAPGSLKATLCARGRAMLKEYAVDRGVPYVECGKLVVASDAAELGPLRLLYERSVTNAVAGVRLLDAPEMREIEPAVVGTGAIHSPATAITDFVALTHALAGDVRAAGGEILLGAEVVRVRQSTEDVVVTLAGGEELRAGGVVACAGLWSDAVARLSGDAVDPRIVPFRGEYYRLKPPRADVVRGLIYPVPDPRYPFLGVHLTKTLDGSLLAGPNAVLAFAREGYRRWHVRPGELAGVLGSPGFRRLARAHWRTGLREMRGSLSRRAFAAAVARYVPLVTPDDLEPAPAGVRAQAVERDGSLVDDFRLSVNGRVLNVRNAPSPAATSSLAIAAEIVDRLG
jgi:L-2-hydroxyglutarate oxidase LhgO